MIRKPHVHALCLAAALGATAVAGTEPPAWLADATAEITEEGVATHGEAQRERAARGLRQVADFWRAEDGDREAFAAFARRHFAGDPAAVDTMFGRFAELLEQLDGHMVEILLAFREQVDLDRGPIRPYDEIFAAYDPSAHVADDFFANRLAFVVLLNFPRTTLEERLAAGADWTRRRWAETRLAERFAKRVPADVQQGLARAAAAAGQYISEYNIWMHHLVDDEGGRLFPPGMKLLSHWNLRDQIKADYAGGAAGLARQRTVRRVMERILDQSIPALVIDNPHVDWDPFTNRVSAAAVSDVAEPAPEGLAISDAPEGGRRYRMLLDCYRAARRVDPYSPATPTLMARRFEEDRELPEERVEAMLEALLSSPLLARTAELISDRLGRPLEPFDIWYAGFRPRGTYSEAELDALTRERFPSAGAYEAAMPELLADLGFAPERAREIAGAIVVEPARGSGHAWGAAMSDAKSHLRTRVGPEGMDYKGFNIAVHEMGHNVEQTISLRKIDHFMLQGVPNTAFTEALAFVFQGRDLELLGLAPPDEEARALQTLDDYWGAAEIAAVALVDMGVWHWMYEHPEATAAELQAATLDIARGVWNRFYAPVVGVEDATLLAIYSHMISSFLYLPDYPIGHMIAHQIEQRIEASGDLGGEFERMVLAGNVAPDLWMENATGQPVGPEALLAAAGRALDRLAPAP